MDSTLPFIRVEVLDAHGGKLVLTQQTYGGELIKIESTSKQLTVKRRDLKLALLSITEEG